MNDYVTTISNMSKRLGYYGNADIDSISFYKLYLKYKDTIRDSDVDCYGVSLKRKLEYIKTRVELKCNDIVKSK